MVRLRLLSLNTGQAFNPLPQRTEEGTFGGSQTVFATLKLAFGIRRDLSSWNAIQESGCWRGARTLNLVPMGRATARPYKRRFHNGRIR